MQWLIDIVLEKVAEVGYLTTSYVDRGGTDSPDFSLGDFIGDLSWNDLDLSAIVPEGAKAVAFSMAGMGSWASSAAKFRKKGNTYGFNVTSFVTPVADIEHSGDCMCGISADRKIQYNLLDVGWDDFYLTVKGWWL